MQDFEVPSQKDDAGRKRDVVAGDSVGQALAVPMLERGAQARANTPREAESRCQALPELAMCPEPLPGVLVSACHHRGHQPDSPYWPLTGANLRHHVRHKLTRLTA